MTLNLIHHAWLPVRRRDGTTCLIAPHEIAPDHPNPVVALDWPRPDFNLAATEFLIGLHAVAGPPAHDDDWSDRYLSPPDAAALQAEFAPLAPCFELDGPGPRFMQDREDFPGEPNPPASLLIDAPGENTIKRNTDIMVRRGGARHMSRATAAMALYTLQSFAPSGGAGNRTGLRGGGPLVTLALPDPRPGDHVTTLWHIVWANTPIHARPTPSDYPRIFPWLAPTRVSDKTGRATTPVDVHPLQAFWGMPRRIRLDFAPNTEHLPCDLTGAIDNVLITGWRQKPWGTNYADWGKVHPNAPCYRVKPNAELLYVHPQPGGIGYRNFLGLLFEDTDALSQVAPGIAQFRRLMVDVQTPPLTWRLLAAGYDMDNMKARGFVESELPVVQSADPDARARQDAQLRRMVLAAGMVAGLLLRCVRTALFGDGTVPADAASLAALRERFWDSTSGPFFDLMQNADTTETTSTAWLAALNRHARALFDEAAPIDASGEGHPDRIAGAARQLGLTLAGYGAEGQKLFRELGLAPPETAAKPKRGKKGTTP
jgi:CRISPR system Cascade subunit CasA